jgi:type VI secretion system protein ImpJ
MKSLSPVIWSEGMHLAQHHFQMRDQYFEDRADFLVSSLFPTPYGFVGLELDDEALLNGTVSLVHARGVMPDGLAFAFPEDPPPPPLDVGEKFSPTRESHEVSLVIPRRRPDRRNWTDDPEAAGAGTRFVSRTEQVPDAATGRDATDVTVGRKNFRLALDEEELEDVVTLPMARIRRDRSGDFVYDRSFVPPCLQIGASSRVLELLSRLTEVMEAKAASLSRGRGEDASGSGTASEEVGSYWLAHAIHTALPALRHHLASRTSHPEEVYADLARLGGALCTFAMESHPRDLPLYQHDDLETCLGALDRHIRSHLEVVFARKALRFELEPTRDYFFQSDVTDDRAFGEAHWFLEVEVPGSREEAISRVPRLVKVCSAKHIVRLVQSAHPGLDVEHLSSPPAEISPRVGAEYFRLVRSGPCWTSIEKTRAVGVYVPETLERLTLRLLVVPDA